VTYFYAVQNIDTTDLVVTQTIFNKAVCTLSRW